MLVTNKIETLLARRFAPPAPRLTFHVGPLLVSDADRPLRLEGEDDLEAEEEEEAEAAGHDGVGDEHSLVGAILHEVLEGREVAPEVEPREEESEELDAVQAGSGGECRGEEDHAKEGEGGDDLDHLKGEVGVQADADEGEGQTRRVKEHMDEVLSGRH